DPDFKFTVKLNEKSDDLTAPNAFNVELVPPFWNRTVRVWMESFHPAGTLTLPETVTDPEPPEPLAPETFTLMVGSPGACATATDVVRGISTVRSNGSRFMVGQSNGGSTQPTNPDGGMQTNGVGEFASMGKM